MGFIESVRLCCLRVCTWVSHVQEEERTLLERGEEAILAIVCPEFLSEAKEERYLKPGADTASEAECMLRR